jgi:hypothetical protein
MMRGRSGCMSVSPVYPWDDCADEKLQTGDEGEMDADGYIKITGRIKDIIIKVERTYTHLKSRTASLVILRLRKPVWWDCRTNGTERQLRLSSYRTRARRLQPPRPEAGSGKIEPSSR